MPLYILLSDAASPAMVQAIRQVKTEERIGLVPVSVVCAPDF